MRSVAPGARANRYLILALLACIGAYRISLVGKGARAFPDEYRYFVSALAVERLANRDVPGFFYQLSSTQGRPGAATINIVPVAMQGILYTLFRIDPRNLDSVMIAVSFNVLISLLLVFVFYKISMIVFRGALHISLFCTLIFALLVNNNIYIRHLLPYDAALLCYLFALYHALKIHSRQSSMRSYIITGLLTGFAYTIYPGYFLFPLLVVVMVTCSKSDKVLYKRGFKKCFVFGISVLSVPAMYELIARIGKTSYLLSSQRLANKLIRYGHGSFEEGFSFLPKYFVEVEKPVGIFILLLAAVYLIKIARSVFQRETDDSGPRYLKLTFVTVLVLFLVQASLTYFLHKMLFFGRLMHMYVPFLIWAAFAAISGLKHGGARKMLYVIMIGLSLYNFLDFAREYYTLAYPRDVVYDLGIDVSSIDESNIITESKPHMNYKSPPPKNVITNAPYSEENNYILVNICYFSPVGSDHEKYDPPANAKLVYKGRHFTSFPAYSYEGYKIKERELIRQRDYHIAVYKVE